MQNPEIEEANVGFTTTEYLNQMCSMGKVKQILFWRAMWSYNRIRYVGKYSILGKLQKITEELLGEVADWTRVPLPCVPAYHGWLRY